MHVPAAAAAGASGAAAMSLFSYNRENFQFDAGLRFQRFTAARGFANAQMAMYREDIQGIAEMTVAKMDTWQTVCTLFLCVCAALSCAGRLGMHGAAPPGWLCALYSGNIFTSILFCGLALWLALHASLRAQCAMVRLLTRRVRLPIPSMAQLDQARVFASSYEKQSVRDIFRVPFMRHPEYAPDIPPASSEDEEEDPMTGKTRKALSSSADFGSTERDSVPSWIRDETVVDKLGGVPVDGPVPGKDAHECPEHFKMMAKEMEDWWMYDVYARVTMLYGVICFLYAVCYYSIGTSMSELRGFWISWSLPLLFMIPQALILRLDILQKNGRKKLPHAEWLGHIAPYLAVCGTTLEFRFWYSPSFVDLTWVFVFLAFSGHLMMALRMLDLAWPDLEQDQDMREQPTRQWWPSSWKVPSAFAKNLWVLAPPKKLELGQHCLQHEMDDLKRGGASISSCRRRRRAAGEEEEVKDQKDWANPEALVQKCKRIDMTLNRLFEHAVWNDLPQRSQGQLHKLYSDYREEREQVERLPESDDQPGDCKKLAETLAKIEAGIKEVQAKSRAARAAPVDEGPPVSQKRFPDLPWQVTRVAIIAVVVQWSFMACVTIAEWQLGPESLLKPPGEPPWIRDQKMRGWTPEKVHLSSSVIIPADYALFNPRKALPPLQKHMGDSGHSAEMEGHGHGAEGHSHGSEEHSHGTEEHSHGNEEHSQGTEDHGHDTEDHGHGADNHGSAGLEDSERRRLSAAYGRRPDAALGELLKALPRLSKLAEKLKTRASAAALLPRPLEASAAARTAFMAPALRARGISWPQLFEPRHLLCSPSIHAAAVALTPRGFGALVPAGEGVHAQPFALDGLGAVGPLVGGAWGEDGLELITDAGELLHCPGHQPTEDGTWSCKASHGVRLPVPEDSRLLAAAVKKGTSRRSAAFVTDSFPEMVAMLAEDGEGWSPVGEAHLPFRHARLGLAFASDELIAVMPTGEVHRRHLHTGSRTTHPAPPGTGREFRSACSLPAGGLTRLALARSSSSVWGAELLEAA